VQWGSLGKMAARRLQLLRCTNGLQQAMTTPYTPRVCLSLCKQAKSTLQTERHAGVTSLYTFAAGVGIATTLYSLSWLLLTLHAVCTPACSSLVSTRPPPP
jgi:hypothetical protein